MVGSTQEQRVLLGAPRLVENEAFSVPQIGTGVPRGRKPKERPEDRKAIAGRINARPCVHNGRPMWRVGVPPGFDGPARRRLYFPTATLAWAKADELEGQKGRVIGAFLAKPQNEQIAVCRAVEALGTRVLEIGEAVRLYLERKAAKDAPLGTVVAECIAEKQRRQLSESYLTGIRSTIERFALKREHVPISQITAKQVEKWAYRHPEASSIASELVDLRTLFSFAAREYGVENVAKLVPFPKVVKKEPGILTVEQVTSLLKAVRSEQPELMRYVALALFGGVRPDEAQRLKGDCVREGYIVVPAAIVKGNHKRRLVKANEAFLAWWNLGGRLPIGKHDVAKVRDLVKPWPHDALRHSFVSYHSALYGEVATATEAGHSVRVSEDHYRAAVTREAAEAFWGLRP